jgi:hypothetical protein
MASKRNESNDSEYDTYSSEDETIETSTEETIETSTEETIETSTEETIETSTEETTEDETSNIESIETSTKDENSVDENSVNENSEDENSEDENSEDENSEDKNTEDENTEDENTEDENTEDENTGDENSVDENSEDEITVVHEPDVGDTTEIDNILGNVLSHFGANTDVITTKTKTECVYKFGNHTLCVTKDLVAIDGKTSWPRNMFTYDVLRLYLQDFYGPKEETLSEYAVDNEDNVDIVQNRELSFNQPTPPILNSPDKNSWYFEESFESEDVSEHEPFTGDDNNEVSVVVDLCRRVSKQDEYIRVLKLKHENLYHAYRKLASQHQEHKKVTGERILQLQGMMRDHTEELDDVNRKIGYLERSFEDKYQDLSNRFTVMNQNVVDYSDKYRHLVENTPTHSTVRHQLASITEEVIKKVLVEKLNPVIEAAAKESAAASIKDFSSNVFNGIMTSTRERITKIERMLKSFGNIADLHM